MIVLMKYEKIVSKTNKKVKTLTEPGRMVVPEGLFCEVYR